MKPFLIIARVGDRSLHSHWLEGGTPLFDIFLSYFGDETDKYRDQATYYEQAKGGKWPEIARIVDENWAQVSQYQAVWFPDDDLLINANDINRMFSFIVAFDLSLAQPALTMNSYFSHSGLLQQENTLLRLTNFVEVMAPVFSCQTLAKLKHTFIQSPSGWGLDNLWPNLLEPDARIAVIDAIAVIHTRPLGGELYKRNPELHPENDVLKLAEQYLQLDINRRSFKNKFRVFAQLRYYFSQSSLTAFVKGKQQRIFSKRRSSKLTKYGAIERK
jgi:hypothetical protein